MERENIERFHYVTRAKDMTGEDSNEVKKDGEEPQSPKELIKEFCSYTTTHGIGRLAEAKTLFSRSIWTVFILGAFAMFIYQTCGLFNLYLRRPVSTAVKEKYKTKLTFPAVTICNQNNVKGDKITKATEDALFNTTYKVLRKEREFVNQQGEGGQIEDYDEDGLKFDFIYEDVFVQYLARQNYTTLSKLGHQYNDFVFDCNYRGEDCRNDYSKYWHQFWDFRYGNCFTFNGGMDDEYQKQTILETRRSGSSGGLKLNLFIELSEYFQFSQVTGARIVIHNQGKMPFPEENGIDLEPASSTSIGVRRKVFKRVDPFNNGSCRNADSNNDDDLYHKKFGSIYSREVYEGVNERLSFTFIFPANVRKTCISSCLARIQIKNCGCAQVGFPVDARLVCNGVEDPGKGVCIDNVYEKITDYPDFENCDKNCSVPCSDVVFETTVSTADWPSEGYEGRLTRIVEKRPLKPKDKEELDEQGSDFVKANFLQVKVFFEQLNFQEVQEELSYKEVNLIADIGGQLGLWIGISVLTCCEVLELVLLLIQKLLKRVTPNAGRVESQQINVMPASQN